MTRVQRRSKSQRRNRLKKLGFIYKNGRWWQRFHWTVSMTKAKLIELIEGDEEC